MFGLASQKFLSFKTMILHFCHPKMTDFMALERLITSPNLCMLFRENKKRRIEYHAIIGNIAITLSSHDATSSLRTEGQGTAS
jgi:hypothetical protein